MAPLTFKITDLFGVNNDIWPGALSIILYVNVHGNAPAASIGAFHLTFAPAHGPKLESTAQVILEPRTFRGPDGEEEIDPENTLWGKDGAPSINGFRSGKLWFAFSNVHDFSFLRDLDGTAMTFSVDYRDGTKPYAETIRLSDIGPVRPVTHPFPGRRLPEQATDQPKRTP